MAAIAVKSYRPPVLTTEDKDNVLRGIKLYELTNGGVTLDLEQTNTYIQFMDTLMKLDMVHRMQVRNALRRIRDREMFI
jgi:hypothetical protein